MSSKPKRTHIALSIPCGVCSAPAPEHFHFGGKILKNQIFREFIFQEDAVTHVGPSFGELFSEFLRKV